jgi:hypothetical protein
VVGMQANAEGFRSVIKGALLDWLACSSDPEAERISATFAI